MSDEMEMETGADYLTLVDDDGVEHEFEVADTADFEGDAYMALIPVFEKPEDMLDDSGELLILKVVKEDEEEFLEAIEDEEEFNRVGEFFTERLADIYDFED